MGRSGIRRRRGKPRRRLPKIPGPAPEVPRGLEGEPLTFEGQMRLLGRFSAGVRHAGPRQRWAVRGVFAVLFLLPLVLVAAVLLTR